MPIDIFNPRTLMQAVRLMPPVQSYFRDMFSTVATFPTESVDVDFYKGKRRLAPFVSSKLPGKEVENIGYKTDSFKPALVSPDKVTTVEDLLNRLPNESLYSGMTPQQRAAQKLQLDLAELLEMITRREEWMAAQAIFTGKIPVIGEGVNYEIDFQFTNKETLSGTSLWTDSNSDPIGYLEGKHRLLQREGYVNADVCVMAWDVANAFINHPKVKDVLDTRNITLGVINPSQLPNGVTYIGRINKLGLDIYQYNEWFLDDFTDPNNPVNKPMVPDGHFAMLSSTSRRTMAYASITLVDKDTKQFTTYESTRVPDSWVEKRPDRRILSVQSKPLPIPHEVDSWYVAKVLA